jgi:NADH-quinone oxidoreductase subunit A
LDLFLGEYLPIAVFFAIAIGLSLAFVLTAFVFGNQRPDSEKMTAYECGFDAFDDSRRQFDVRFYLVAILFIIFDLEVAFLFPWAGCAWWHWVVRFLVNDAVSCRFDHRLYL